jgi:hypothetical protein
MINWMNKLVCFRSIPPLVLVAGLVSAQAAADPAKLPPPAQKAGVTFESDIRPIMEKSCVRCHGPQKPKAKLRLDNLVDALKGSDGGKILEPGNSANSLIVQAVARLKEKNAMPPKGMGEPLTPEQVGLIRAWIDQGAK